MRGVLSTYYNTPTEARYTGARQQKSASGHSRPGRIGCKSGNVRYGAESGNKSRALAAAPLTLQVPRRCIRGWRTISSYLHDRQADPRQQRDRHSLEGTPRPGKPGVIGRLLTESERFDLIKYLKTV
jgi:hypothetical protein